MASAKSALIFFEEDGAIPAYGKPLMLESVLFCPILRWACDKLLADGVERFFLVCGPRFAEEARSCFPKEAQVLISEQKSDLDAFLTTPDPILVLPRAALPMGEAGVGAVYEAPGYELLESWKERLSNQVSAAELVEGWIPIFSTETIVELEPLLRQRILNYHLHGGVHIVDPHTTYIDPRVTIGAGSTLLPGTILEGDTEIGSGCTIGPNSRVVDCAIGDGCTVNASQLFESKLDADVTVGPFAYVRPGCHICSGVKLGDFVEVKNSRIGKDSMISHLTYVGDSDVGSRVNFGCGTVTCNYDGVEKHRCTIGDRAFLGCNTNLVAPVTVGEGAYTAAGSTITGEVPAGALAVARSRQKNIEGWVLRKRPKAR